MNLTNLDKQTIRIEQEYIKTLKDQYDLAKKNIENEISQAYLKYSKNGSLDLSVMSIVDKNKISRLDRLLDAINKEVKALDDPKKMASYLGDVYTQNKNELAKAITNLTGVELDLINREAVYQSALSDLAKVSIKSNQDATVNKMRMAITQSIVRGESIQNMAKGIGEALGNNLNNAVRIARTETTRVMGQARDETLQELVDEGVEVMKVWVSTNDSRTRDTHQGLQGQKVEFNKNFSNGLRYPGDQMGSASEVINCRCTMTSYFPEYEDEKSVPLAKPKKPKKVKEVPPPLETNFPKYMSDDKKIMKEMDPYYRYINGKQGADPKMLKIYNNFDKIDNLKRYNGTTTIDIKFTKDGHYVGRSQSNYFNTRRVEVSVPKFNGDYVSGRVSTLTHEFGHYVDLIYTSDEFSMGLKSGRLIPNSVVRKYGEDVMKNGVPTRIAEMQKNARELSDKLFDTLRNEFRKNTDDVYNAFKNNTMSGDEYRKISKKLLRDYDDARSLVLRDVYSSLGSVEDIVDAITSGNAQANKVVRFGHGRAYYADSENIGVEIWANYSDLAINDPSALQILREEFPDIIKAMDDYRDEIERVIK